MSFAIQSILFILLVFGPLPLGIYFSILFQRTKKKEHSLSHNLLLLASFWICFQTFIALVSGTFRILSGPSLFALEFLVFCAGILLLLRGKQYRLVGSLFSTANLPGWKEKIIIILLAALFFASWLKTSGTPVTNFDSLYYHLPMAAHFYQTGSTERLAEFAQIGLYPYHWELVATLFLFPFQNDFQVVFVNYIAAVIWILSVYRLSREFDANRSVSLVIAGLSCLMPLFLDQMNSLQVDLAFAALFLAVLYFLVHFLRTRQASSLLLFLLCSGVLAGIKMSAVGYLIILWGVGAFWLFRNRKSQQIQASTPLHWAILASGITGMLFMAGYWYVLNWLQTGNPLGLVNVQLGPMLIFQGNTEFRQYLNLIYPHFSELEAFIHNFYGNPATFDDLVRKTSLFSVFEFTNRADWSTLYKQLRIQGGIPFLIFTFGTLISLIRLLFQKEKRELQTGVFALLAATALLYWLTPYSGDNGGNGWKITDWIGQGFRYGFPVVGLAAVLTSRGIRNIKWSSDILLLVFSIITVQTVIKMTIGSPITMWPAVLFFIGSGIACFLGGVRKVNVSAQYARAALWALLFLLPFTVFPALKSGREEIRAQMFSGLEPYLQANTKPGEKVGYLISFFSYPLYTGDLNRIVTFTAARDDLNDWLYALQNENIRLVAIGPYRHSDWEFTREYKWFTDPQGAFIKEFGDDARTGYLVFRHK